MQSSATQLPVDSLGRLPPSSSASSSLPAWPVCKACRGLRQHGAWHTNLTSCSTVTSTAQPGTFLKNSKARTKWLFKLPSEALCACAGQSLSCLIYSPMHQFTSCHRQHWAAHSQTFSPLLVLKMPGFPPSILGRPSPVQCPHVRGSLQQSLLP